MRWQKGATMENNNIANYVNIFACVQFKSLSSILFAHYSNARSLWKGRSGLCCHVQNMSNALAFRQAVMSHCYRLVLHPGLRLNFIVTVELLKDQAGSDFVQYQIKMQAFVSRICSEFKQIELNWSKCFMETGPLYNPTMKQTNFRAGCKSALQPGTMTGRRSETLEELFIYLFSSADKYKGFSLYEREDWRIDWNQLQLFQF